MLNSIEKARKDALEVKASNDVLTAEEKVELKNLQDKEVVK